MPADSWWHQRYTWIKKPLIGQTQTNAGESCVQISTATVRERTAIADCADSSSAGIFRRRGVRRFRIEFQIVADDWSERSHGDLEFGGRCLPRFVQFILGFCELLKDLVRPSLFLTRLQRRHLIGKLAQSAAASSSETCFTSAATV